MFNYNDLSKIDMSLLEKIFLIQKEHVKRFYDLDRIKVDREYRINSIKDYILGIHEEATEFMETTDWKKNYINQHEDIGNSRYQLIDIMKYNIGLMIMLDMNWLDCYQYFVEKSETLDNIWNSVDKFYTEETKVVIFDIDGVLANYSLAYEKFLKKKGLSFTKEIKKSYYMSERYGFSRTDDEKFLSEFIAEGGMANLEVYKKAKDFIYYLKSYFPDVKIILITARPAWIYQRLYGDTINWLNSNNIMYDMILWNKDKAEAVVNKIFPAEVLFFVEDRDKHAIELSHIGIKVLLIDKDYNQGIKTGSNIIRMKNWNCVYDYFDKTYLIKNGGVHGKPKAT